MGDKKKLVENCIEWATKAEEILECPVCFKNNASMLQCYVGHLVCEPCRVKLGNVCPTCRGPMSAAKCYVAGDITKTLSSLKLSLNVLDKDVQSNKKLEDYRKLMRAVLTDLSTFLSFSGSSLTAIAKHLDTNDPKDRSELERQMVSWTSKFHHLKQLMNNTEATLKSFKL